MAITINPGVSGVGDSSKLATTTNDLAAIGNIGEIIEGIRLSSAPLSLTSSTPTTITSLVLTAGDWDVTATAFFNLSGLTGTSYQAGISLVNNTLPLAEGGSGLGAGGLNLLPLVTSLLTSSTSSDITTTRISLATTTTVYLVGAYTFTVGTASAYGNIWARRAR